MERSLSDTIDLLMGDVPVSEQLSAALNYMAPKDHTHNNYVTREEYEALRLQIEMLSYLVGDRTVAEQISEAISGQGG